MSVAMSSFAGRPAYSSGSLIFAESTAVRTISSSARGVKSVVLQTAVRLSLMTRIETECEPASMSFSTSLLADRHVRLDAAVDVRVGFVGAERARLLDDIAGDGAEVFVQRVPRSTGSCAGMMRCTIVRSSHRKSGRAIQTANAAPMPITAPPAMSPG